MLNQNSNRSSAGSTRKLKIEKTGDFFARRTKPAIRLKGKWLEAAGFPPGEHVHLHLIAPGVLELRVSQPTT